MLYRSSFFRNGAKILNTQLSALHHSERWQQAMTGDSAVITKWRNKPAILNHDGLDMVGDIDDLRKHLLDRGFVRCRSL